MNRILVGCVLLCSGVAWGRGPLNVSQKVFAVLSAEFAVQRQMYQDAAQAYGVLLRDDPKTFSNRVAEVALLAGRADLAEKTLPYLPDVAMDQTGKRRQLLVALLTGRFSEFSKVIQDSSINWSAARPWMLRQFEGFWRNRKAAPTLDEALILVPIFPESPEVYGWAYRATDKEGNLVQKEHFRRLIAEKWPRWYPDEHCPKVNPGRIHDVEGQLRSLHDACRFFYIQQLSSLEKDPEAKKQFYRWASETYDANDGVFKYDLSFPLNYYWGNRWEYMKLLVRLHEDDKATVLFSEIIREYPKFKDVLLGLMMRKISTAKWTWQQKYFFLHSIRQSFPDWVEPYFISGMLWAEVSVLDKAIPFFEKVLVFNADHVLALNALGFSLAERKRSLNRAKDLVTRALKQQPNNPMFLDSMAWVLYRQGLFVQAKKWIDRARRLAPNDPEIREHYELILKKMKRSSSKVKASLPKK